MNYRTPHMRSERLDGNPFVCQKMPFVCHKSTNELPLVCKKIPLIRSIALYAGFSLMELLITLTIVGITAAFAVPAMTNFIRNQRISAQTNDLISDLVYAKSEASKRSDSNVVICGTVVGGGTCSGTPANHTNGRLVFVDTSVAGVFNNTYSLADGDVLLRERLRLDGANTATQGNILQGLSAPLVPILNPVVFSGAQRGAVTQGAGSYVICVDAATAQAPATAREVVIGASGQPRVQKRGDPTYINSCV